MVVAESGQGSFVVGISGYELLQVVLLFHRVSIGPGLYGEDKNLFSFGSFVGQGHRFFQVVKEIFSGGGIVGVSQFGGSELGVERDGFFKMRKRVVGKQSFGKIASLEKFLAGFVGLGCDRDFAGIGGD